MLVMMVKGVVTGELWRWWHQVCRDLISVAPAGVTTYIVASWIWEEWCLERWVVMVICNYYRSGPTAWPHHMMMTAAWSVLSTAGHSALGWVCRVTRLTYHWPWYSPSSAQLRTVTIIQWQHQRSYDRHLDVEFLLCDLFLRINMK